MIPENQFIATDIRRAWASAARYQAMALLAGGATEVSLDHVVDTLMAEWLRRVVPAGNC